MWSILRPTSLLSLHPPPKSLLSPKFPCPLTVPHLRHATKKAGGSSRNGRDSPGQRLGLKLSGGQAVRAGNIIARQRGLKWLGGEGVGVGKDHTLFAKRDGFLKFTTSKPAPVRRSLQGNWRRPMSRSKKIAHVVGRREDAVGPFGVEYMPRVVGKGSGKEVVYSAAKIYEGR